MADVTLSLNLATAAGAALAGGALARVLRQSVLVGYIAGGMVISPLTPGPVSDTATIEHLADIGVVLLMFGIGIHFSLRELIGARTAALGAVVQIPLGGVVAVAIIWLARAGWTGKELTFFAAAATISGGTVLTKLISERGEDDSQHARVAIGWSVTQDLATVVLVVLLGVIANGNEDALPAFGLALLKAVIFLGGMLLVGTRVLPPLLAWVARLHSRELFILAVAGLSLGAAVISSWF